MAKNNSRNTVVNFIWRFFERVGAQGVTMVVSILLARILDPTIYGTIALVTVFTTIMSVFIDSGLGTALIQKKDADNIDFSTVFFFNITAGLFMYLLIYLVAPAIAAFYDRPELVKLVRVIGLTLIISGVKNIQQAYVSRHMLFKKFFFSTLGGTVGAAVIGIWMAYHGYGIWAVVVQNLFNQTVDTIILWITVRWRPNMVFSWRRFKGLFSFGWKLLASALLDTVYNNLRSLIIGKKYSSADLAFYNKGNQFPNLLITNINSSIDSVLLPTLSVEQTNRERVREMTRRAIKTSTYLLMPLMMGLSVCATPIIRLLLTEKWLPAVPYLRIFCFTYAFYPIHTANLNAIKAMGRSDYFLRLEVIKKVLGVILVAVFMWFGVLWMAYSLIIGSLLSQIINAFPNKRLLNYSYFDQIRDMLPQILLSCLMGGIVYAETWLGLPDVITLLIQIPTGVIIYTVGSKIWKIDSFAYILQMGKSFLKKRNA